MPALAIHPVSGDIIVASNAAGVISISRASGSATVRIPASELPSSGFSGASRVTALTFNPHSLDLLVATFDCKLQRQSPNLRVHPLVDGDGACSGRVGLVSSLLVSQDTLYIADSLYGVIWSASLGLGGELGDLELFAGSANASLCSDLDDAGNGDALATCLKLSSSGSTASLVEAPDGGIAFIDGYGTSVRIVNTTTHKIWTLYPTPSAQAMCQSCVFTGLAFDAAGNAILAVASQGELN